MNILFITHYSSLYGANRSLLLLLEGLKESNFNSLVLVPDEGLLIDELKKRNIAYRKFKFWAWMGVRNQLFFFKAMLRFVLNIAGLPILLAYAIKFKPSVIYSNSSISPIGIYLSLILGIPHIWHIRELGKLDYNLDYDFGKNYFYHFMCKSDAIITISQFVKDNLFAGQWKNITIINNAVYSKINVESLNVSIENRKDKAFTFLIMSIVYPSKGIHDAIEALGMIKRNVDNIKLIICGSDEDKEYKKYLNDLIEKLDLREQVFFSGFVEKPFEMYKIVDAVLVCSKYEAWGRVAAEAMVYGKPVIGYNGGGTKEIITNNFNGLLYSDINELATCMKTVLQNRELVKSLTSNAKKYALERYSNLEYTDKILSIITKLGK